MVCPDGFELASYPASGSIWDAECVAIEPLEDCRCKSGEDYCRQTQIDGDGSDDLCRVYYRGDYLGSELNQCASWVGVIREEEIRQPGRDLCRRVTRPQCGIGFDGVEPGPLCPEDDDEEGEGGAGG